jgi:hypothetical protein
VDHPNFVATGYGHYDAADYTQAITDAAGLTAGCSRRKRMTRDPVVSCLSMVFALLGAGNAQGEQRYEYIYDFGTSCG